MSNIMNNIDPLMSEICKLPKEDFDDAVLAISAIIIGTLIANNDADFVKGFLESAMNSDELACLKHFSQVN